MSARLRVQHRTTCRYAHVVPAGYHEVRLTPATTREQTPLRTRVDVAGTADGSTYRDYWGSQVTAVEVLAPHGELTVTASSTVDVDRPPAEPPGGSWELLHSPVVTDEHAELLADDAVTRAPDELVRQVRAITARASWPDDAALAVCALLHETVPPVPPVLPVLPAPPVLPAAASGVGRSAGQAWAQRWGSVRDLAHLAVGALRCAGLPARYVTGYAHPDLAARVGTPVAAAPHAWVEWWSGDWFGWDTALGAAPGDGHVVLARGRSHADVPAVRGVAAGAGSVQVDVEVALTRVA